MAKNQAANIEKYLREKVNGSFILAMLHNGKLHFAAKSLLDVDVFFALHLGIIDSAFSTLRGTPEQNAEFRKIFLETVTDFIKEWSPHEN